MIVSLLRGGYVLTDQACAPTGTTDPLWRVWPPQMPELERVSGKPSPRASFLSRALKGVTGVFFRQSFRASVVAAERGSTPRKGGASEGALPAEPLRVEDIAGGDSPGGSPGGGSGGEEARRKRAASGKVASLPTLATMEVPPERRDFRARDEFVTPASKGTQHLRKRASTRVCRAQDRSQA
eukprot:1192986-Prorocentrum_minimum.AAC.3